MNRALQQGMIGGQQQTLQGSEFALGPNRYLTAMDFFKMLALALLAHAVIFIVASLFPSQKVTEIPVRALNFRLGDGQRVEPLQGVGMETPPDIAPPSMQASTGESWRASAATPSPVMPQPLKPVPHYLKPQPKVAPVKPQAIAPETATRVSPAEYQATPTTPPPEARANNLPNPALLAQPAIAPNPQQYVREVGAAPSAAGGASAGNAGESAAVQQVRARYEQQISNWIQMHKFYPAGGQGQAGRVVMRIRIDRTGAVRYYAIDESSRVPVIDAAAIEMVRRANPMPAVPVNYPAANLIEFLIPLNFAP